MRHGEDVVQGHVVEKGPSGGEWKWLEGSPIPRFPSSKQGIVHACHGGLTFPMYEKFAETKGPRDAPGETET